MITELIDMKCFFRLLVSFLIKKFYCIILLRIILHEWMRIVLYNSHFQWKYWAVFVWMLYWIKVHEGLGKLFCRFPQFIWMFVKTYLKYLRSSTYLGLSIWRYSNIQINWREKSTMIMFQEENNYINVAMKSQFLWVFKVLMLWNVLLGKIVYIHEI